LAGETEVLGEHLPQGQFVHHKSHMTRPGFDPGPPRWEAGNAYTNLSMADLLSTQLHFVNEFSHSRCRGFNTANTKSQPQAKILSNAQQVPSTSPPHNLRHRVIMVPSHLLLGLPSIRFSRGFPTKILHVFLSSLSLPSLS
jgi:hypothetical protein